MSQNSKYLFPTRSSLVKEPEAVASAASVSVSGEAGTYPARSSLSTTFFQTPKFFFEALPEDFSPAQKRELIPTPSRCQQLFSVFFKKLFTPPCPASRPCPAQRDALSRSGENGLCTSARLLSTTFYFFPDFFDGHHTFLLCFRAGMYIKFF